MRLIDDYLSLAFAALHQLCCDCSPGPGRSAW